MENKILMIVVLSTCYLISCSDAASVVSEIPPDKVPPLIETQIPGNGSVDVGVNSYISVVYSESMNEESVKDGFVVEYTDEEGNNVFG